jgi:hypothetical protein
VALASGEAGRPIKNKKIVETNVNLETLARELGALEPWESLRLPRPKGRGEAGAVAQP